MRKILFFVFLIIVGVGAYGKEIIVTDINLEARADGFKSGKQPDMILTIEDNLLVKDDGSDKTEFVFDHESDSIRYYKEKDPIIFESVIMLSDAEFVEIVNHRFYGKLIEVQRYSGKIKTDFSGLIQNYQGRYGAIVEGKNKILEPKENLEFRIEGEMLYDDKNNRTLYLDKDVTEFQNKNLDAKSAIVFSDGDKRAYSILLNESENSFIATDTVLIKGIQEFVKYGNYEKKPSSEHIHVIDVYIYSQQGDRIRDCSDMDLYVDGDNLVWKSGEVELKLTYNKEMTDLMIEADPTDPCKVYDREFANELIQQVRIYDNACVFSIYDITKDEPENVFCMYGRLSGDRVDEN